MVSNVRRMSAFRRIGDRLIAAAQVAGVVATGWFVWIHNVRPRLGVVSLASMFGEALLYVALAWMCGIVVMFFVYFMVLVEDLPRATRFSVRNSTAAMWFAPAIVLLSTPLAGAFAGSLFLVANATRQLISKWGVKESTIRRTDPALIFRVALLASLAAQAGLVAMLWSHSFPAAALFALSTAILTSLSISTGAYRPGKAPALPHSALSVVLTFLLAATLTFGGISVRGRGGAGSESAGASGPGGASTAAVDADLPATPTESMGTGGDFPGVILLPEVKPYTTLFVPLRATPGVFGVPLTAPRGIPFSGEYWMFRFPATRPPRRSIIRRGDASELSFHTTDRWPIEMEAHQKLDPPVSAQCCSQIQLAILNNDQYPGTVSPELILIDTSSFIDRTQSLGTVPAGPPSPGEQILSFTVPRVAAVRQFDEIKVIFHRARLRADRSARMAIERFVLVP